MNNDCWILHLTCFNGPTSLKLIHFFLNPHISIGLYHRPLHLKQVDGAMDTNVNDCVFSILITIAINIKWKTFNLKWEWCMQYLYVQQKLSSRIRFFFILNFRLCFIYVFFNLDIIFLFQSLLYVVMDLYRLKLLIYICCWF
jgi:hypothetical protein